VIFCIARFTVSLCLQCHRLASASSDIANARKAAEANGALLIHPDALLRVLKFPPRLVDARRLLGQLLHPELNAPARKAHSKAIKKAYERFVRVCEFSFKFLLICVRRTFRPRSERVRLMRARRIVRFCSPLSCLKPAVAAIPSPAAIEQSVRLSTQCCKTRSL